MKKLLQQLTILLALLAAATINAGAQVTEDRMLEFQIDANGDGAFNANGEMIDLTGQYTWESSTNTLTLSGVTWETTADTAFTVTGLAPEDSLTIQLGDGTVNSFTSISNDSTGISFGMYMKQSLIITGGGTLNINSGATRNSLALFQDEGDLIINSGTVKSTGSTTTGIESHGIYTYGSITINGGTVTAIGGDAGEDSAGIVSDEFVTINGGVVSAKGGDTDSLSYGISTLKINIAGGEVEATGSGNAINAEEEFNLDNPYVYWISTSTTAPGGDGNKDQGFYNSDTYKYVKIVMPIYRVTTLNHVRADMEYALPGDTVRFEVDTPPDSVLVNIIVFPGVVEIIIYSSDGNSGYFTMPAEDVTISAAFVALQDTYQVVTGKYVTSPFSSASEGEIVTYAVDTPPDLVLVEVSVIGASGEIIFILYEESGEFPMPAENVFILAVFEALQDTYQVITGEYVTSPFSSASEGDTVTYTVDLPPGFVLDSVIVVGASGEIISTSNKESGYFVMPAEDVTIMAVFGIPIDPDPDPAPDPVANIRLELTDELTVRIHSIGELPTGELTLMLEGDEAKYFTLPEKTVESIASGDFSDIMLAPADCMGTGCYRVTLIVKGEGVESFIHIFYSHTKGPVAVEDIEGASVLRSWVENGQLRITGLTPGEHWQVYSLTGSLVHTAIADNDVARLPLPARGVYIVSASGTVLKVLY